MARVDLMLTIFGKKKKDEASPADDQATAGSPPQTSTQAPPTPTISLNPTTQTPMPIRSAPSPIISEQPQQVPQQPVMRPTPPPQQIFRPSPMAPLPAEETSLTRLLQSLLADIPLPPDSDSSFGIPQTTPDYVPARSTPPSRPMVISPGTNEGEWDEPDQPVAKQPTPTPQIKPKTPEVQPPPAKTPSPAAVVTPTPKKEQPSDKAVEKPSKVEKQPEKPSKEPPPKKAPQSFDHIMQLTQGNLDNAGLVIINSEAGSGRTTLCSGLTSNYMKNGNACLYLTCDQSPSALRDQMKKLGTDAAQYESGFRLIIVDGFASQSDSFSMEMYYVDQPFNLDNVNEALTRSTGMFVGEKVRIIFDSMDNLAAKMPSKDLTKAFTDIVNKLKDSGSTVIVTVDMSKVSKDLAGSLNDLADCVIELSKDDSDPNGRELKVQKVNHSPAKIDAETFEIDSSKGLVFV